MKKLTILYLLVYFSSFVSVTLRSLPPLRYIDKMVIHNVSPHREVCIGDKNLIERMYSCIKENTRVFAENLLSFKPKNKTLIITMPPYNTEIQKLMNDFNLQAIYMCVYGQKIGFSL